MLPELQRNKDAVRCAALGAEVPGHRQQQLTQNLIVRLLKTYFLTQVLDCEKSTEYNWVSDQTWSDPETGRVKVLVAGGCDGWCVENPALASAESWDPDTGEWTPVADMPTPLSSANVSLD